MKSRWLVALFTLLTVAGFGRAQFPEMVPDSPRTDAQVYGSVEYLWWWIKSAPVPTPLITTGPSDLVGDFAGVGVLGAHGTQVLIGSENVGFGPFSGGRFTAGAWLDADQSVAVEGSYLFLDQRMTQRVVSSSGTPGSALLGAPFFNVLTGKEDSISISGGENFASGSFRGTAVLQTTSRLQGAELNVPFSLTERGSDIRVEVLGGFRWLNLDEGLSLTTSQPFNNIPADIYVTYDDFLTRNSFYGGQIGARAKYNMGMFFAQATGKVALGDMHETVRIGGSLLANDFDNFGKPQVFPGGNYALPSNSGTFHKDRFAVVPEANLNVGVNWGPVRVFVGYSFLYVSDVVRPGNQIDRAINPNQSVNFSGLSTSLTGPRAPLPQINSSDFWAQGLNFGLELRF